MSETERTVKGDARSEPARAAVPKVLVVTNDFPPRVGGVQQYVWNIVRGLPADHVSVLAPNWPGWRAHDAGQPFPVHRWPSRFLWPTGQLARRVRALIREHDADVVLFGHGLPLPALAPDLRANGVPSVILTHGAELWLARTPGAAEVMRRAFAAAREVTSISRFVARELRPLIPRHVRLSLLPPAVDPGRFSPTVDGSAVRARFGLQGRRVVLCVSRLVPRKGQDTLIRGMCLVNRLVPDAALLIVGGGPYEPRLRKLAANAPAGSVMFAGEISEEELPACYAACDVFAMPCRSRFAGLEIEGFGIVFLEAAAAGKAIAAGRSGGAEEAIRDEVTGLLVEGREPKATALTVARLLLDTGLTDRMGRAGRARVEEGFTWAQRSQELADVLSRAVE